MKSRVCVQMEDVLKARGHGTAAQFRSVGGPTISPSALLRGDRKHLRGSQGQLATQDRGPARIPNSADCSNSEETLLPGD